MLTSVLLAAALSIGASPAAYDNAQAHQSYQIMVISHSDTPMAVHTSLAPDSNCSVELARTPTWAHLSGPSSFTLAAHAEMRFVVSVGQPPPGQSELIAAFIATGPSPGGVHTNAGVGTALRFSEPGHTVIAPCPQPKRASSPNIRTVTVGQAGPKPDVLPLQIAVTVLGGLLLAAAVAFAIFRRPRRSAK